MDYDIFINRLNKTYQDMVTKEAFNKLIKLKKDYKSLCLNVGYGNYIFEIEKDKKYIQWYLGVEKELDFDEAVRTCELSYFKINMLDWDK